MPCHTLPHRADLLANHLSQRLIDSLLPARSGFLKVIKNVRCPIHLVDFERASMNAFVVSELIKRRAFVGVRHLSDERATR